LTEEIEKNPQEKPSEKKRFQIQINRGYCKSCGICYWVCPTHAIGKGKLQEPIIASMDACIGCGQCERLCPDFAINITARPTTDEEKVILNG